ncbi:MAG: hypothetical protein DI585_03510 [Pseudomonas fluorescens]|nr:MAG: hypothetical protein DI585_03510 [Pseudomonas fluorescens]
MLRKLLLIALLVLPAMASVSANAQAKQADKVGEFATASLVAFNPVMPKFGAVVTGLCKKEETKDVPLCKQDLNQKGGLVISYLTYKIVETYPTNDKIIKFGSCIRASGAPSDECKPYIQNFLSWIPEVGSLLEVQDRNLEKLAELDKAKAGK